MMNTGTRNTHSRGLTLIEITLVIAVLLGLITVLFLGVSAYKEGANRAECILNVSTTQKAVRSHQNLFKLAVGDPLNHETELVGEGKFLETAPECPTYGGYDWDTIVPAIGTPYIDCWDPNNGPEYHHPQNTSGW